VPQPARVWCARQLEHIGGAESIATLKGLLGGADAELQETARRALEKNSSPEATAVLRDAFGSATGAFKAGLAASLGARGDTAAVTLLAGSLSDPATAGAAAAALGKIASPGAVTELWAAWDRQTPGAGDALVEAGRRLVSRGDRPAAAALATKLFSSAKAPALRAAALSVLGKADPGAAKPVLATALAAGDVRVVGAALAASGPVLGADRAAYLAAAQKGLPPAARILVLNTLGTPADQAAEGACLEAAADGDARVRVAALGALGRIGGAAAVPALLAAAASSDDPVRRAGSASLARLSGPEAAAALRAQAGEGDVKLRSAAIQALADRHDAAALPALWKFLSEPELKGPALSAIAKIGADADVEPLARLALAGETAGADAALQSVAARVADKHAAAGRLLALLPGAPVARVAVLFEALSLLGDADSLAAIAKAASTGAAEVRDAAVRSLAGWPEFAAVEPLLALAGAADVTRVHNVLAVQGIARLVQSADRGTAAERVDAAVRALKAAQRPEDRRLVLSALGSVNDRRALDAMVKLLADPAVKEEAAPAAAAAAEALFRIDRAAAKALAQAVTNAAVSSEATRRAQNLLRR
jgi:HEAT repeat protein